MPVTHDSPTAVVSYADRELRRIRTFYVDDRAEFVIDGRAYTDGRRVRQDIASAVEDLHRRRLRATFYTDPAGGQPRGGLPSWQVWRG